MLLHLGLGEETDHPQVFVSGVVEIVNHAFLEHDQIALSDGLGSGASGVGPAKASTQPRISNDGNRVSFVTFLRSIRLTTTLTPTSTSGT